MHICGCMKSGNQYVNASAIMLRGLIVRSKVDSVLLSLRCEYQSVQL